MAHRALALAALLAASGAWPAEPARRVVVLVAGEAEAQLASRVEGQLADLDATVRLLAAELPSRGVLRRDEALRRGQAAGADAVAWLSLDDGAWVVHVAAGGQELERALGPASGRLAASTAAETVAVVVRTALVGLWGAPEPAQAPPAPEASAPPPARGWAELAWTALLDGQRPAPLHGVVAAGGVGLGPWRLGLRLGYLPPVAFASALASASESRWQPGAVAALQLLPGEVARDWRLEVELGAEAAALPRATTSTATSLLPTPPATTWTPVLGAALRGGRRLAGPLWVTLALGADGVARPLRLEVAGPSGSEVLAAQWPVQPRATLGLTVDGR